MFFSQNVNNVQGMKRRVAKYLLPVLTFSVLFNVPKFFEAEIEYVQIDSGHNVGDNVSFFGILKIWIFGTCIDRNKHHD